jgi:putative glutamine amidotransferase
MISAPPLIGVPGRRHHGRQIADFPGVLAETRIDSYLTDNATSLIAAGGLPVHLPLDADPVALVGRLDGLLLTGGADVDPVHYGGERHEAFYQSEPERDTFELALTTAAFERGVPVLAICRGLQLLNVHGGGTLVPDIPIHSRLDVAVDTLVHDVVTEPGSRLAGWYGDRCSVNSLHHQAVDVLADGYTVTARADDGTVEGIELRGADVVAVQWHPEMLRTNVTDPAFAWLVERAAEFARGRG